MAGWENKASHKCVAGCAACHGGLVVVVVVVLVLVAAGTTLARAVVAAVGGGIMAGDQGKNSGRRGYVTMKVVMVTSWC